MRERKSLLNNQNFELLLWSLVLFLILAIADDMTKTAFDRRADFARESIAAPRAVNANDIAQSPEMGN